ncbi:MAG TPA: kelch repeat-containing protein [Bryobacteraceae bacterium]|nr:kelch repeat-containing protein [Bryobacteraceae bacterium]
MKTALMLLLWCAALAPGQSSVGAFTATGAMTVARSWHTATLLKNGRVLIAGGVTDSSSSVTASAELYDPTGGTFSPTGNMTIPRAAHTAILLSDGRVLIAGGFTLGENVPWLTTAEIYDPSTGTFTATSDMIHAHECGQAHVLNNGKVLLSGGSDDPIRNLQIPDAQLYDPTTGSFSAAGTYATVPPNGTYCGGRASTSLVDGRVLIVWEDDLAEIYDPETGSFIQTGKPLGPSYNVGLATATLLMDGKVLVAGGDDGSNSGRTDYTSTELFDAPTGSFAPGGSMSAGRDGASATLLPNGTVLIAGGGYGYDLGVPYGPSADVYDPVSGIFRAGPEMVTSRSHHTATLLNDGRVLIAGGDWDSSFGPTPLAELYTTDVLTPAPVLLSLSGDGKGQGAVLHAGTARAVTASDPAVPGEALEIYGTGLKDGSVIPPQVDIGGRMAEVLWFGNAPGYPGLNQNNVRVPAGIAPGPAVRVWVNYLSRPSNEVTIGVN